MLTHDKHQFLGLSLLVRKLIHYFIHLLYSANYFNLLAYEA